MAIPTWQITILKGGGSKIVFDIQAGSQKAATEQAEAMIKSNYPGYKRAGAPKRK